MTKAAAETMIAARLARQVGSLTPGFRHVIQLDQVVSNGFGGWRNGPHPIGWVETSDGVRIRLVATEAAATARALLAEDLLDIVLTGYPAVIRLTVLPTSATALT